MLIDTVTLSKAQCKASIQAKLKYATTKNFVGRIINGYDASVQEVALMTKNAAEALCEVQNFLYTEHQFGLLVFDAYRPKKAVLDFMHWVHQPIENSYELERKTKHYPHLEKTQLFEQGYLAEDSYHCYGNTVDLVLIDRHTQQELDMGARFDFMDELAHLTATPETIGENAYKNRLILQEAMMQFNFEPYEKEFWHFSHRGIEGREVKHAMDINIVDAIKKIKEIA